MKHLLTAIACCLAVAGRAQTPYNPDSNGDGFVGSADLVSLLSLYGELAPVDSLTVVTADALELLGYQNYFGDSVPVYQVAADADVVLAPADTCMRYYLTANAADLKRFWYESSSPSAVQASGCWIFSDSLVFAGCNNIYAKKLIMSTIFLNGKWYCMD